MIQRYHILRSLELYSIRKNYVSKCNLENIFFRTPGKSELFQRTENTFGFIILRNKNDTIIRTRK